MARLTIFNGIVTGSKHTIAGMMAKDSTGEGFHNTAPHLQCSRRHTRLGVTTPLEEQVDVVSHQDIGVDLTPILGGSGSQTVAIKPVVLLGLKNRTAIIPPLDHVLALAEDRVPRESRHKRTLRSVTHKRWIALFGS